ncbi:d6f6e32c-f20c-497c-a8bf-6b3fa217f589 [Thermothielavioides terrestris]|jgi:asparagine synthase (glutamine-hydrolysing)
MLYG